MIYKIRHVIAATSICTCSVINAQSMKLSNNNPLSVSDIISCSSINNRDERLSCFDKNVDKLKLSSESGDVLIISREDLKKSKNSLFGFSIKNIPIFSDNDNNLQTEEIKSVVKELRRSGYSSWIITLDDGAIWQTTEVDHAFDPKVGSDIRIRRGAMGGYLANLNDARAVRVRRIG